MLTIRREQLAALEQSPRRQFEEALERHLRRYFPHECEQGDVPRFVQLGIDRAEYHGFDTRVQTALYLNLMVMLGAGFDEDPQISWAGRDMDDPSVQPASARLSRVYDAALGYLDEIGGPDLTHLVRAKVRIRRLDSAALESEDPGALLADLYPQKAARQGDDAMEALVDLAVSGAEARGATSPRAAAINALHMFLLGSAFHQDPMYPWAGKILDDQRADSADARFDKLLQASLEYMERTWG